MLGTNLTSASPLSREVEVALKRTAQRRSHGSYEIVYTYRYLRSPKLYYLSLTKSFFGYDLYRGLRLYFQHGKVHPAPKVIPHLTLCGCRSILVCMSISVKCPCIRFGFLSLYTPKVSLPSQVMIQFLGDKQTEPEAILGSTAVIVSCASQSSGRSTPEEI